MSDISEIEGQSGAVYLAKNFASQEGYTSVTSTLPVSVFGVALQTNGDVGLIIVILAI